jgi:hypothetical protein
MEIEYADEDTAKHVKSVIVHQMAEGLLEKNVNLNDSNAVASTLLSLRFGASSVAHLMTCAIVLAKTTTVASKFLIACTVAIGICHVGGVGGETRIAAVHAIRSMYVPGECGICKVRA